MTYTRLAVHPALHVLPLTVPCLTAHGKLHAVQTFWKKRQKVQEQSIAHLQSCTSHAVNRSDVPLITGLPLGKTHFVHCLCCEYMMDIEQVRSTVSYLRHSPLLHRVKHIYMHNNLQLRSTFWRHWFGSRSVFTCTPGWGIFTIKGFSKIKQQTGTQYYWCQLSWRRSSQVSIENSCLKDTGT